MFVATSTSAAITVTVYDGVVDAAAPPPPRATATGQTTAFAKAFHGAVVTVPFEETAPLSPGQRVSYDVSIALSGGPPRSLRDLNLLTDQELPGYQPDSPLPLDNPEDPPPKPRPAAQPVEVCSLGYAENQLPSFVTCPPHLEDLVIAHASCRKPHGEGVPALGNLDTVIDDLDGEAAGRPHMLFLTGDQIYADDVAAALLPGLTTLGIELLGGLEQVPSPVDDAPLNVSSLVLPAGFRQKVTGRAHFTSAEAASHLLGFGEWLAMYCVAWNPALWPILAVADTADLGTPARIKEKLEIDRAHAPNNAPRALGRPTPDAPEGALSSLYAGTAPALEALASARNQFLDEKARLDDFRREVPRVRRLLANVPTYMICDDHDVTDDWFMTAGIRDRTLSTAFGRSLLRNALSAYIICQAWGNDPVGWATEPHLADALSGVAGLFTGAWSGGLPDATAASGVDAALGLAPAVVPPMDFAFSVDGPMHRVRVLDTRTQRQYDAPDLPPGLLTQRALDRQLPRETLPDGHVLVVVSPAPVFGPPIIADIAGPVRIAIHDYRSLARSETQRSAAEDLTGLPGGQPTGIQANDAEHWGAHPLAFERLLDRLGCFPRVVVLAGDVHYGAAFAMDWTRTPVTGDPRTSRIVHFTSSAAKNGWPKKVRNLLGLSGLATGLQRIGLPMTRLGWSSTLPPVLTDLGTEPPMARLRVRTGPVLLSDELFREQHQLARPPEWLWRAMPITDVRPSVDRPPAARVPMPAADLPGDTTAVHSYDTLVALHSQALSTAAVARGLQFINNAALITFAVDGDELSVSQSLYSLRPRPQPNETADVYILHTARLDPDPVPVPIAVGPGAI